MLTQHTNTKDKEGNPHPGPLHISDICQLWHQYIIGVLFRKEGGGCHLIHKKHVDNWQGCTEQEENSMWRGRVIIRRVGWGRRKSS